VPYIDSELNMDRKGEIQLNLNNKKVKQNNIIARILQK